MVNLEERPATVTVQLIGDDGNTLGRPAMLNLAARGRAVLANAGVLVTGQKAGPVQGYLLLSSDSARIHGAVRLGDTDGVQFQTALPLVYQTRNQWLFAHVASDETYFTGVAVLNGGGENADVTLTVLDAAGRLTGSRTVTLAPRSRLVKLLPEILTALPSMRSGSIRVNASQPVAAYAVFGTHSLYAISAIPGH